MEDLEPNLESKLNENIEAMKKKAKCFDEVNSMYEKSIKYSKYGVGLLSGSLISSLSTLYYLINNNQTVYIPLLFTSIGLYFGYDELSRRRKGLLSSISELLRYKC